MFKTKIIVATLPLLAATTLWGAESRLANKVTPQPGETAAPVDSRLQIRFDATPALGNSGQIKIFRAQDDQLVDSIDLSGSATKNDTQTAFPKANTEIDALAEKVPGLGDKARYIYYRPITIQGNTAQIQLHNNKLEPETTYYVTIEPGVFTGKMGGNDLAAISKADGWRFTTHKKPSGLHVTVDDDGPADFRSVQGALNYMMAVPGANDAKQAKTITIKNGTYNELLFLRGTQNLTLTGESREGVVVQQDNFESFNPGTGASSTAAGTSFLANCKPETKAKCGRISLLGGRAVFLIEGADLLTLSNFTLKNSHIKVSQLNQMAIDNQAETIYFNSDEGRLSAIQMNFISAQDTILVKGYSWFYQSLIAGDVDFIWGYPRASLIENSEVRSVVNTTNNTGYIVQSRAYSGSPGFVFLNSRLTAEPGVGTGSVYLARSGGAGCTNYNCDNVAYINTQMGLHIQAAGWLTKPMPSPAPSCSTRNKLNVCGGWNEFGSVDTTGKSIEISAREPQSAQIPAATQAQGYATRAQVFQSFDGGDGWNPEVQKH